MGNAMPFRHISRRDAFQGQSYAPAPRPELGVAVCRIVRKPSRGDASDGARTLCVACGSILPASAPAVAIVDVPAADRDLIAGICAVCAAARDDRELIAAVFAALQREAPSLRVVAPGGRA